MPHANTFGSKVEVSRLLLSLLSLLFSWRSAVLRGWGRMRRSRLVDAVASTASLAAAKAAYEAPEYQEMLKLRQPHSNVSLSIIEEGDHAGH